jgi:hypothetical protein
MLDLGEATCLGLTCRHLYILLKHQHPNPINLEATLSLKAPQCYDCNEGWQSKKQICTCLANLSHVLANWIGPRYRLSSHPSLRLCYFNKDVYGEYNGQQLQDKLLAARYWDFEQVSLWQRWRIPLIQYF